MTAVMINSRVGV